MENLMVIRVEVIAPEMRTTVLLTYLLESNCLKITNKLQCLSPEDTFTPVENLYAPK